MNYFSRDIVLETKKWLGHLFRERRTLLFVIMAAFVGLIVLIKIEFFMSSFIKCLIIRIIII
jgi:hypothetical protein